ncbi:DeoR/GlpR family transcriptional regulator [Micrococcales bacterium 31B]|nr:DeoR/GlpR family transcriptional regulator [Micrococcales bacterium 31B]
MTADSTPRFANQRQQRLLDELRDNGSLQVRDMAERLGVSELTVRRDLNTLASQGLVDRVHGGATLAQPGGSGARGAGGWGGRGWGPDARFLPGRAPAAGAGPVSGPVPAPVADPDSDSQSAHAPATLTLGMVVPSLEYYWPHVMNGAKQAAQAFGVRLVVRGSTYDAAHNLKQVQALCDSGRVSGLLVGPTLNRQGSEELLRFLDQAPVPVVLAERRPPHELGLENLSSVSTRHEFGAALAVRHLAASGRRRIATIMAPNSPTTGHVMHGVTQTLHRLGLDAGPHYLVDGGRMSGAEVERRHLEIIAECRSQGVDALLIHPDQQALTFTQNCLDQGLSIPDDFAIVAYDDEVAHLGQPSITAVRPPKEHVGALAVQVLLRLLGAGDAEPREHVTLNPTLNVRESTVRAVEDLPPG